MCVYLCEPDKVILSWKVVLFNPRILIMTFLSVPWPTLYFLLGKGSLEKQLKWYCGKISIITISKTNFGQKKIQKRNYEKNIGKKCIYFLPF